MRYFDWLDFQYLMAALFVGVSAVILAYVAWAGYSRRLPPGPHEDVRAPDLNNFEGHPVGPFLLLVYIIIPLWSVCYFLYVLATGTNV